MRTARSLTISRRILRMPPTTHTPPGNHTCPLQPHTPPHQHMPSTTMHAPQQPHMPLATRHAPRRPHMPHPTATVHASPWTEWRTGVKILPCPELRLRAVTRLHSGKDVYRPLQWWPGAGWPCPLSQIPPPCRDPSLLEGRWVGIRQLDRKWHHTETTLVDRQTPVKILPCCKLRLRAVTSVYDITNHTSTLAWWKFYEHILYKFVCAQLNSKWTRMHSSRMRTGRSLTVCRGGVSAFRGCLLPGGLVVSQHALRQTPLLTELQTRVKT